MTDAQYLFDLAARQFNELGEVIEKHFESVADQIRDWKPKNIPFTAPPPPPPPKRFVPVSYLAGLHHWSLHHRAATASLIAFFGTGAVYLYLQRSAYRQKRRARRTADGARTEVVILAGSPTSTLTTALALDLERRGYIVYIITSSADEVQHVRAQSRVDVLPLNLDPVYPELAQEQVTKIHDILARHHTRVEGEKGFRLDLAGVVLIPDSQFLSGSIADMSPETWSNALNAKVLNSIVTTQHLWPLITDFQSKVLLLSPSIIPSLNPPNHAIQSTVAGALQGFSASLASELSLRGLRFCHFKLGHLDIPSSQSKRIEGRKEIKGTPLRHLHDSVFDALQAKRPRRTWHVGKGSLTYDLIGSWLPSGVVGWMIGLSKGERQKREQQRLTETSELDGEASAQWEKIDETERGI